METTQEVTKKTILVTGGAGYIGAHTVRQLLKAGHDIVIIDNLSTGSVHNVQEGAVFYEGDFADLSLLTQVFTEHSISAVIHFAASLEVGESVEKPIEYLENNTIKTGQLIQTMLRHNVRNLIFSSTAAVYGLQEAMPIPETAPTGPLDPYGSSKLLTEQLIQFYVKFAGLNAIIFRFFNACGSDFDQTIIDGHNSHLITRLFDAVAGRTESVSIFGTDYNTIDGTGVRDYVHVLDIARAHVVALNALQNAPAGCEIYNIGTSSGLSVKQIIAATEQMIGQSIPAHEAERRPGDSPITVADNTKIRSVLGFELQHSDIETIIKTSWR